MLLALVQVDDLTLVLLFVLCHIFERFALIRLVIRIALDLRQFGLDLVFARLVVEAALHHDLLHKVEFCNLRIFFELLVALFEARIRAFPLVHSLSEKIVTFGQLDFLIGLEAILLDEVLTKTRRNPFDFLVRIQFIVNVLVLHLHVVDGCLRLLLAVVLVVLLRVLRL